MDISSYIAALSISMSNYQVQTSKGYMVLQKAMDNQAAQAQALIQDVAETQTVAPPSSHKLDVYV